MKKFLIIFFGSTILLIGGLFLHFKKSVPLGIGEQLTEVPSVVVTKLPDTNVNIFQNLATGEIKKVQITSEEYKALGLKNAGQPQLEGYKWLYSWGGIKNETTSTPTLSDYQYYYAGVDEASSTLVMIKMPDKATQKIKAVFIIDNKLTDEGLTQIK